MTDNSNESRDVDNSFNSEGSDCASQLTSRRKVLAAGATWATVGLAGCSGGGSDDDTTDEESPEDTETTDDGPEPTPDPSPQPENYIVSTNTYWNGHPAPEGTGGYVGSCSPERQFRRDMDVTFVIGVYDSNTGDTVSSDAVDSVTVSFPNHSFDDVSLSFTNPDDGTPRWNGTFDIPDNAETGSVEYEVQVSNGDANFYRVGIAADSFSIIEPTAIGESNYVVTTNTYWNGHPAPPNTNGFVGTCSPERQFRRSDMDVTFVIGLYNSSSGEFVTADDVDGVTVTFPESDQFDPVELTFTPAEDDAEPQWNETLDLTESTPTGQYNYAVNVEGGDQDAYQVGVASAWFEVIASQ